MIPARSVCNQPQVCELEHQQLDAAALEIHPRLGAVAAALAPADDPAAEGRMNDARADRETVAAGPRLVIGQLAVAEIYVSFARRQRAYRRGVALRRDTANQRGVNLAHESRLTRLLAHAVNFARQRVGEIEQLPRARHADVAEAALLLDFVVDIGGAAMRKQALLHPGDEHDRVFEAL